MAQGTDVSTLLNVIHATASDAYQTTVPLATASNITDVGEAVLNAPSAIRNEFMANLYNKIGLTLIDTPVVENQFSFLKKGRLEYGQTIEDLYVGLAESEPYITGMGDGETPPDPFAIRKLPHFSAFYSTILSRQYHVTRHLSDLRKAFHNAGGLEQFVAAMMNSMVSRENYDDMRATIALVARQVEEAQTAANHNGTVHLITDYNALYGTTLTADTALADKDFLKYVTNQLKKWSNRMKWLRTDLNIAGVENNLPKNRQRVMMVEDIMTDFETELLAWAYNQGNLQLDGIDGIDAWYSIGADDDPAGTGVTVSPDDIQIKTTFSTATGESVQCLGVIYDTDMVKIYNKERIASEQANGKGNYWNMFMSVEDIYACSPYKNFVAFMLD
jgi:hypothetical protein